MLISLGEGKADLDVRKIYNLFVWMSVLFL